MKSTVTSVAVRGAGRPRRGRSAGAAAPSAWCPAPAGRRAPAARRSRSRSRCASSGCQQCGQEPRVEGRGPRRYRSPIASPSVARRSWRDDTRRAAYSKSRGLREEELDEPRHAVLGQEATLHRPFIRPEGARSVPRRCARIAAAASSAEVRPRYRPSPVNGSRKPAASPTSSQRLPALRVTRFPSGQAPASESTGGPLAHATSSPGIGGDGRHDRVRDGSRAAGREPAASRPARARSRR